MWLPAGGLTNEERSYSTPPQFAVGALGSTTSQTMASTEEDGRWIASIASAGSSSSCTAAMLEGIGEAKKEKEKKNPRSRESTT